MTTNTTSSTRMYTTRLFSVIFFTTLPSSKSSVSVDEDVSTSEESVDIEAERTSTITRPISTFGSVESIVGMMES